MVRILVLFFLLILPVQGAPEQSRTALIMGNWNYGGDGDLKHIANDAFDMAKVLKSQGFEVIAVLNGTQKDMAAGIKKFGDALATKKGVGLVYYSGHGAQADGVNYFVPVDAKFDNPDDIKYDNIPVEDLIKELNRANNGLNIIIMDACRNNPFAKSVGGGQDGLAKMSAPKGSIVAFATDPGNTSSSGEGRNSLYTKHLLEAIQKKGTPVEDIFKQVLRGVSDESQGKQIPWMSTSFTGDFYFSGEPTPEKPQVPADEILWKLVSESKVPDMFTEFLKKFPDSPHADDAKAKLTLLTQKQDKPVGKKTAADLIAAALALEKNDQKGAAQLYLQAAQMGDVDAQVKMGMLFQEGKGLDQNDKEAFFWYKKAADQGNMNALSFLAVMYEEGRGTEKDLKQAAVAYKQAADKGSGTAQEALADMYQLGSGVERDLGLAAKYYKLAADQGRPYAQVELGRAYLFGQGVDRDPKQALHYLKMAADKGDSRAQATLGELYDFGDGVDQDPEQAVKWYQKVVDQGEKAEGFANSAYNLALSYAKGNGVPQDTDRAVTLYERAGKAGHAKAWNNLGLLYKKGAPGLEIDLDKALTYYEKAGSLGLGTAWYNLGLLYDLGAPGLKPDKKKALDYYRKADEQDVPDAATNIGILYSKGDGVPQDDQETFKWSMRAATLGDASGAANVAILYEQGLGVKKDLDKAKYWANKAKALKEQKAKTP